MAHLPVLPPEARRILELARSDRGAAREALAQLSAQAQTALLLETPVSRRAALLDLVDQPESVVPGLPAADLCLLARSIGLEEAGWLLSCATNEQLVASIDLDAWDGALPDRVRFGEWLAALADAGEETLLRATHAIDFEMLVLQVRARSHVVLKTNEDDWEPPAGGVTVDGVFYFVPRAEADDLSDFMELIQALFSNDYWMYFRLAQGGIWELDIETEEWALRWRRGRLEDLGFPNFDDAMRIYSFLRPDRRSEIPTRPPASTLEAHTNLPVSVPPLPIVSDAEHALFRAMAGLEEAERAPVRAAFLELANRVAMADRLPLGEPETLEKALEKAARVSSRGIVHLAEAHGLDAADVLRRVTVERLFQVGHNLAPEPRKERATESETDPETASEFPN